MANKWASELNSSLERGFILRSSRDCLFLDFWVLLETYLDISNTIADSKHLKFQGNLEIILLNLILMENCFF